MCAPSDGKTDSDRMKEWYAKKEAERVASGGESEEQYRARKAQEAAARAANPEAFPIAVPTNEGLAAGIRPATFAEQKTKAVLSAPAPDLTDAALRSYTRANLLRDRLSSTGRRGSFLASSMGDVTKNPGGSILGGM